MNKSNLLKILTVPVFAVVFFCHCSNHPSTQTSALTGERPAQASQSRASFAPEYTLGFGDVLDIKFFRNTEFNETVTVRPDGRISLAKVGELYVAGMTPSKLDSVITATYGEIVRNPDVTVIVRDFGGYQVYVLGEVTKPGGIAIQRNMTVLQAIAAAGGRKISAQMGSVMILRRGKKKEIDAIKVNLKKSVDPKRRADILENDILVEPQDIVFVPKTFIANVSDFMRQVYAGILPPLDLYLRAVIVYDEL
ncbi:sugar transporter [candidate division KSB1 bacterium]|nr:sugar transporter [candidate division KSB1 bacterium]NIR68866.1 sugar transporter [candidate division KSB1 bacterium]NIS27234.1 sugar transporter [candidate division KSB1 bacterium]NIT74119.1 sugar transporter [candidate division KSB1 bacterium]NIU27968.1 sugar transporter [candidate division KSB1 bacterium]